MMSHLYFVAKITNEIFEIGHFKKKKKSYKIALNRPPVWRQRAHIDSIKRVFNKEEEKRLRINSFEKGNKRYAQNIAQSISTFRLSLVQLRESKYRGGSLYEDRIQVALNSAHELESKDTNTSFN